VTFSYDAVVADRGVAVTFEVADGETVALLGPNGAGKSTVLAVIAGLLRPDRGEVVLDDRVLTRRSSAGGTPEVHVAPHDRQVALLAQEALLFPHLDVLDNVAFGPRSRGTGRDSSRATADRWLAEVGAGDLADRRPGELSGGQAQRVAVGRALAAEPRLLLLDEPMAALDVAVTPALRQMLRRVLADQTVVLVTHDALDALLLADRVIVLEGGRVVEDGPSAQVLGQPRSAFAAQLAGLNMLTGFWRDEMVVTEDWRTLAGEPLDPVPTAGDAVVAVFPPRAVSIFLEPPGGSPRNVLPVTVTDVEPQAGHVRVRAGDLTADVTARAVAELDLAPGVSAYFAIKATEVSVYAT
jgi:molybdate transport system ATP-binding protein